MCTFATSPGIYHSYKGTRNTRWIKLSKLNNRHILNVALLLFFWQCTNNCVTSSLWYKGIMPFLEWSHELELLSHLLMVILNHGLFFRHTRLWKTFTGEFTAAANPFLVSKACLSYSCNDFLSASSGKALPEASIWTMTTLESSLLSH